MEKYFKYVLILFLLSVLVTVYLVGFYKPQEGDKNITNSPDVDVENIDITKDIDKIVQLEIVDGSTYGTLMEGAGLGGFDARGIYEAAIDTYDLSQVRLGRSIELIYDIETNECKGLDYQINAEEVLCVRKNEEGDWEAKKQEIDYEIKIKIAEGTVQSSMYEAALQNGIDERAIVELANAFQWTIDFAMDPRVDDTFKFLYEELYLDGEYIMPGRILAGRYVNSGTPLELFYFEENEDNKGYFDGDGNSVQKMFLKAPVAFKYISSGFTNGRRYVEAFSVSTNHRAIDYAADAGAPIRSVGDGVVTFAGWSTVGYGNLTKIRHNGTYSTNYAHQSRIIVSHGQRVKQGQVIGYVGSTGFSTGPHLHYEMIKNGYKVNPLREILPPGEPIDEENQERFSEVLEKYRKDLN
jgi:murein DD-endopeptidase MepM/ murein hydrolase activator NlpD